MYSLNNANDSVRNNFSNFNDLAENEMVSYDFSNGMNGNASDLNSVDSLLLLNNNHHPSVQSASSLFNHHINDSVQQQQQQGQMQQEVTYLKVRPQPVK